MSSGKISAGLLMYRRQGKNLEVFLVHLGGPFFKNNPRAWGLPKGELHDDEEKLEAAKREFCEETGITVSLDTKFCDLGSVTYQNGKQVFAWAFKNGDFDPKNLKSNLTPFGWPEIDRGDYFPLEEAKKIIFPAQEELLLRLEALHRAD